MKKIIVIGSSNIDMVVKTSICRLPEKPFWVVNSL